VRLTAVEFDLGFEPIANQTSVTIRDNTVTIHQIAITFLLWEVISSLAPSLNVDRFRRRQDAYGRRRCQMGCSLVPIVGSDLRYDIASVVLVSGVSVVICSIETKGPGARLGFGLKTGRPAWIWPE
jgi:hypothetical protein